MRGGKIYHRHGRKNTKRITETKERKMKLAREQNYTQKDAIEGVRSVMDKYICFEV